MSMLYGGERQGATTGGLPRFPATRNLNRFNDFWWDRHSCLSSNPRERDILVPPSGFEPIRAGRNARHSSIRDRQECLSHRSNGLLPKILADPRRSYNMAVFPTKRFAPIIGSP